MFFCASFSLYASKNFSYAIAKPPSYQLLGDSIYHPGPEDLGPDEDDREVWEALDAINEND